MSRRLAFAILATLAAAGLGALSACGNGDDTASIAPRPDAGADATTHVDASAQADVCIPDDRATCNACATPAQDPLNGCSPYSNGCIPFDAARVPVHPDL